jgi:hypothetical protein
MIPSVLLSTNSNSDQLTLFGGFGNSCQSPVRMIIAEIQGIGKAIFPKAEMIGQGSASSGINVTEIRRVFKMIPAAITALS